jgi:cell division protein FtsB
MTTDRVLPPVSLSRNPGRGPASISTASARRDARWAPIAAAGTRAQSDPWRRDRSGTRVGQEAPRPTGVASAARLAKPRGDALLSTATRAGVLIGVSAAVYAVSLAAVSGLQAQSQAQAAAAAQPALDALTRTKAANDQITAAIQDADARLQALAHDYDATSTDMAAYQAEFQQLSALVAKIQGSAAAMNANFKLPSVTMRGAISSGGGGGTTVVTTTGGSGKP